MSCIQLRHPKGKHARVCSPSNETFVAVDMSCWLSCIKGFPLWQPPHVTRTRKTGRIGMSCVNAKR